MVVTISYDGGGWTVPYLIGITAYLQQHQQHPSGRMIEIKYTGVSCGACVALAAAMDVSMAELMEECVAWADVCRPCPLMTLHAVRTMCRRMIGGDDRVARLVEKNAFAAGVTRVDLGGLVPVVVSEFEGEAHLIDVVASSCRLPLFNSLPPPTLTHCWVVDGILSARFFEPPWESDVVVRVSPSKDRVEADICCQERVPLARFVVPLEEDGLRHLYNLGVADGPALVDLIFGLAKKIPHTGSGRGSTSRTHHDRRPSLDQRLHVGGRCKLFLPARCRAARKESKTDDDDPGLLLLLPPPPPPPPLPSPLPGGDRAAAAIQHRRHVHEIRARTLLSQPPSCRFPPQATARRCRDNLMWRRY